MLDNTGCVIIGRNEGDRLIKCLNSVCHQFVQTIYVDSGSTDNSVQVAESFGAVVIRLDMSVPFTAARARNAGVHELCKISPGLKYVQFIDGDCELLNTWAKVAVDFLEENADFAVVCGRRRERYPSASIYNLLCDIEWDTPVGEASSCGGDALVLLKAFHDVSGFNSNLIAGEEPEMCHRLRMNGWKIYRLDEEMTLHDANIKKFSQWWKRGARGGYAYFSVYWHHRNSKLSIWKRNVFRTLFWACVVPFIFISSFILNQGWLSFVILLYPVLMIKIYNRCTDLEPDIRKRFAFYMVLIKFAELQGGLKMIFDLLTRKQAKIMEYK